MRSSITLAAVFLLQALCSFFFVSDILSAKLAFAPSPVSWEMREYLEIFASLGLITGLVLGGMALRNAITERNRANESLRRASSAFFCLLEEKFIEWALTPAERDVALFAVKGLSTQNIAVLRSTSEGTVKAQTNAIYRKAGVSGRSQLLSVFIEDLMRDDTALAKLQRGSASTE
jgi:DNA-binding CsgD family transcriptional regulator